MGQRYLLDTNILIYFIKSQLPLGSKAQVKEIILTSFIISVVTKIEFLGWPEYNKINFVEAEELLNEANIIHLNKEIISSTIHIKRNYNLKLGDAIIAATALENKLILVSRNTKDFTRVPDLKLYNPFETA